MKKLAYTLLKLKSYQLFILILLPIMASPFGIVGSILALGGYLLYIFWIFSLGIIMNTMIPIEYRTTYKYFKFGCIYLIIVLFLSICDGFFNFIAELSLVSYGILFFSIGISFYVMAFAAKQVESVVLGRKADFQDSLKAFICIWFYPFGIWHIQPAVKRVLDHYEKRNS